MKSFPFDSEVTYNEDGEAVYDRASDSKDLRDYFNLMYTNGVFPNPSTGLQVVTNMENMSVTVKPGAAIIQGAFAIEESERAIAFEASEESLDRIDSVVIRLNTNLDYRTIDLYVVKGEAAGQPVAPELTRAGGIYELRLANVFVARGTTKISQERITDTRLNAEDCGIATCNPQKVDTKAIYDQYQASLDEWLKYVAECIDGTTAGKLQSDVKELETKVPFSFGIDSKGRYGYIKAGADTVIPFKHGGIFEVKTGYINSGFRGEFDLSAENDGVATLIMTMKKNAGASYHYDYSVKKNGSVIKTETITGDIGTYQRTVTFNVSEGDVITITSSEAGSLEIYATIYVSETD